MVQQKLQKRSAQHYLAVKKTGQLNANKTATPMEVVSKVVHQDFTYAMVNYKTSYCTPEDTMGNSKLATNSSSVNAFGVQDLTVYVVYDHRINN